MRIDTEPIEDGKLRLRSHVTAGPQEPLYAAEERGLDKLRASVPTTHWIGHKTASYERARRGRESSRRIFLTLIAVPRPNTRAG